MSDQPYNSLGQILAAGGDVALAYAISAGWSQADISDLFARRFEPMRPEDRTELRRLAEREVAAGQAVAGLAPNEQLPLADIPINPELFGNQSGGGRLLVIGEVSIDSGESWFQIRLILPDNASAEDLAAMLEQEAEDRFRRSPRQFDPSGNTDLEVTDFRFISMSRRF